MFTSYVTKEQAEQAFKAAQERARGSHEHGASLAFVVWTGRSVGLMSHEACMRDCQAYA